MSATSYGRYTVDRRVGQGGMSVVYRGTDPVLDRPVALKVMHPHLADRAESRARFAREARAVARLRHPHIVEVYDHAPPESEQAYIVTEFIDGPTLRTFAEEHPLRHPEVAALIALPIAEALAHAHAQGIVHRDVKPENIMLRADGSPVLMDFGIAQMVDMETLTATGTMLGSPAHMAPEVVDGAVVGPPSDVFSLGTVLYWMVCGALPFAGPNPSALFRRILEGTYDPVLHRRPHAGKLMARLIERCLARDPAARPTSAELVEALRERLAEAGITDPQKALCDFLADPEVWQDNLSRDLVPRLVTGARAALEAGRTALALDRLDRALVLDEHHPEAQRLLARIERGQRAGARLRLLLVAAGVIGILALAWWLWPEGGSPRAADAGLATMRAALLDGTLSLAALPDAAGPVQSMPDGAIALPAPADAGTAKAPDAGRRPAIRPRPNRPAIVKARPDAAVAPTPATAAEVRLHGQFKGAEVFVDGERRGYLYAIERDGGLKLGAGEHRIEFKNPGCLPHTRLISIRPGETRGPPVVFDCALVPATLRVDAPERFEVRRTDTGRLLGHTNQDIRFPMRRMSEEITLTVGDPNDRSVRKVATLTAGQRRVIHIERL